MAVLRTHAVVSSVTRHEVRSGIQRFERFRKATGIDTQTGEAQANTLIYTMGEQADDIFISFKFTAEQEKNSEEVKKKNSKITSSQKETSSFIDQNSSQEVNKWKNRWIVLSQICMAWKGTAILAH